MEQNADPEFVISEEQEDDPIQLTFWQRFNILGFLRLVVGQIRDSSGRPNNLLGLLYVAVVVFCVGVWWGTHPVPVRYEIDLKLNGKSIERVKPIQPSSKSQPTVKRVVTGVVEKAKQEIKTIVSGKITPKSEVRKYKTPQATVTLNLTLNPPPALPASFWWVLLLFSIAFLVAYLARHPKMRGWFVNTLLAYRAVQSDGEWAKKIIPFMEGFMNGKGDLEKSKLSGDAPALGTNPSVDGKSQEPIIDESSLPKREH